MRVCNQVISLAERKIISKHPVQLDGVKDKISLLVITEKYRYLLFRGFNFPGFTRPLLKLHKRFSRENMLKHAFLHTKQN